MAGEKQPGGAPFWADFQGATSPRAVPRFDVSAWVSLLIGALRILVYFFVLSTLALLAVEYPWLWALVVPFLAFIAWMVYSVYRGSVRGAAIREIQQRAQETTGAELIGSALHTAGHPLLKVDQPVVLALKGVELSLYSYESSAPIDVISIKDLQVVATVVYDDDHVPHTGVADSTAQAIQITFAWHGQPCPCVFRLMRGHRPIDWYQAIQAARLGR